MKLNIHDCRQARQKMDFLANDSTRLDKSELERHLRVCPACAREFAAGRQTKTLLKRAFKNAPGAPASLRFSIQNLIRGEA